MSGRAVVLIASVAIGAGARSAAAQPLVQNGVQNGAQNGVRTAAPPAAADGPLVGRPAIRRSTSGRDPIEQMRYQIGTMERVLENAVEHGASLWRDRLQAFFPVQALLLDNPRVRGYRLDDYGLFFDIDVPSLETTLFSAYRTLDQNGLGVQSAMNQLKAFVQAQAAGDTNLQQAIKRLELQVGPTTMPAAVDVPTARTAVGSPSLVTAATITDPDAATSPATVTSTAPPPAAPTGVQNAVQTSAQIGATDAILANPEEAYRTEVMRAVVDALLDYSAPLALDAGEWLTVGVHRNEVRPRMGLDTNAKTFVARVRGSDLAAFRAGQLTREEAIKRVELRVF